MSNICDEDRPTTVNTALLVNNTEMQKMDFMLLGDPTTEMYSFDPTFHIVEDTFYKIKVSFSIFDGLFHIITTQKFRKQYNAFFLNLLLECCIHHFIFVFTFHT